MKQTKPINKKIERKLDDLIIFKPNSMWRVKPRNIYPDPMADALEPKWWQRLIFWKKWNYQSWIIKREYISLNQAINNAYGKPKKRRK